MALLDSFEKSGNFLFKYRGQFPVFLFILSIPFIYQSANMLDNQFVFFNYLSLLFCLLGVFVRAYTIGTTPKETSGRNTDKQVAKELNEKGIYSMVRHPLYLGNYFIWLGVILFTHNIAFLIIFSLLFWLYYERIMFAEEQFLTRKFGSQYMDWSHIIPAFIPSLRRYKKTQVPFSLRSVLRREYSGFLAISISFAFIDLLRNYFISKTFKFSIEIIYINLGIISFSLILKILKKYSTLLAEKDRS